MFANLALDRESTRGYKSSTAARILTADPLEAAKQLCNGFGSLHVDSPTKRKEGPGVLYRSLRAKHDSNNAVPTRKERCQTSVLD